jgi:peroxiredoxin
MLSCVVGCAESSVPTADDETTTAVEEMEIEYAPQEGVEQASAEEPATDTAAADTAAPADTAAVADTTASAEATPAADVAVAPPVDAAPAAFKVGDAAPKFADLVGVDDQKHSLDDFAAAKVVAVVFTCNSCPVAVAYEDRLIAYQKDYADKGVQLVAINVNNAEPDRLPAMKTRATEKGFEFPYLYDPTQKSAREYGAEVTPHVFLLDGQRKLAYVGPVDDNMDDPAGAKPLLRQATDAVLEGKAPEVVQEKPVGCGIKYE